MSTVFKCSTFYTVWQHTFVCQQTCPTYLVGQKAREDGRQQETNWGAIWPSRLANS